MRDSGQLKYELRQAGATTAEVSELLPIVSRLKLLKSGTVLPAKRTDLSRWLKVWKPAAFTATGLALGVFLVIMSQVASPTSWLYPVQKFSDSIAVHTYPQYRAAVMMKRAQQVNQLVAEHASSKQVFATLADYMAEADTYQSMPRASYAAFDFCKTNLQQAASTALPAEKAAIVSSLQTLEST